MASSQELTENLGHKIKEGLKLETLSRHHRTVNWVISSCSQWSWILDKQSDCNSRYERPFPQSKSKVPVPLAIPATFDNGGFATS